jgi:hypothetical protein
VGEEEYLEIMEKIRTRFPGDPCVNMISIDYFTLRNRYDEALEAISLVEKSVGGDPYLRAIRASTLVLAKRLEEAAIEIEGAIREDAGEQDWYWIRVTISLQERKHGETLAWLKRITETFSIELDGEAIATSEEFTGFAKSPEFGELQKWLRSRPGGEEAGEDE